MSANVAQLVSKKSWAPIAIAVIAVLAVLIPVAMFCMGMRDDRLAPLVFAGAVGVVVSTCLAIGPDEAKKP